jgi:hypothetical protein
MTGLPFCGWCEDAIDEGGEYVGLGLPSLFMSTNRSNAEKRSGLLCCETESPLCVDRDREVCVFLGTGRIQGGRVLSASPFDRVEGSRGIRATDAKIGQSECRSGIDRKILTSTELFHEIPRTDATHIPTAEAAQ